jgi:hypothetical protein
MIKSVFYEWDSRKTLYCPFSNKILTIAPTGVFSQSKKAMSLS